MLTHCTRWRTATCIFNITVHWPSWFVGLTVLAWMWKRDTCCYSVSVRTKLRSLNVVEVTAPGYIQAMHGFIWPKQYGLPCLFLMQLLSWTSWSSKASPNKLNFTPMIQNRIPAGAGKIDFMMGSLIEAVCTYGYRIISSFTAVLLQYTNVGITCVYVDSRTGTTTTFTDETWLWSLPAAKPVSLSGLLSFDASFTYKNQHCNMINSFLLWGQWK